MKAEVEITQKMLDEAVADELKKLRTKVNKLISEREKLKSEIRQKDDMIVRYHTARGSVLDLAELYEIGRDWS
jgi:hypothetical protein